MLFKRKFFKPKQFTDTHDDADLGFDESFSQEKQYRFLNKDGSFNVVKKGLTFFQSLHLYHTLLTMSWIGFYIAVFGAFVFINFLFALIFFSCGNNSIYGVNYTSVASQLIDCFFFSVQSFTTVGYGQAYPLSITANLIAIVASFVGLLSFALATGISFARFSRPITMVQFSENALISPYKKSQALIFRLTNCRAESELIHVSVKVVMTWFETNATSTKRKFKTLNLVQDQVTFMPAVWTVIHPINDESPLHYKTNKELEESDVEFLITLNAFDETFSQTVYKRSSYKWFELKWDANFTSMISRKNNGLVEVDVSSLNSWEDA